MLVDGIDTTLPTETQRNPSASLAVDAVEPSLEQAARVNDDGSRFATDKPADHDRSEPSPSVTPETERNATQPSTRPSLALSRSSYHRRDSYQTDGVRALQAPVQRHQQTTPPRRVATEYGVNVISMVSDSPPQSSHGQADITAEGVGNIQNNASVTTAASAAATATASSSSATANATASLQDGFRTAMQTLNGFAAGMMKDSPRNPNLNPRRSDTNDNSNSVHNENQFSFPGMTPGENSNATSPRFQSARRSTNTEQQQQQQQHQQHIHLQKYSAYSSKRPTDSLEGTATVSTAANCTSASSLLSASEVSSPPRSLYQSPSFKYSESTATTQSSSNASTRDDMSRHGSVDTTDSGPLLLDASPMARMRSGTTTPDRNDAKRHNASLPKTPEQVKAEKQRKWKQKMKLAQEKQRIEREHLSSAGSISGRRSRRRSKQRQGLVDSLLQDFIPDSNDIIRIVNIACGNCDHNRPNDSDDSSSRFSNTSSKSESEPSATISTPRRHKSASRSNLSQRDQTPRTPRTLETPRQSQSWTSTPESDRMEDVSLLYETSPFVAKDEPKIPDKGTRNDSGIPSFSLPRHPSPRHIVSPSFSPSELPSPTSRNYQESSNSEANTPLQMMVSSNVARSTDLAPFEEDVIRSRLKEESRKEAALEPPLSPVSESNPNDKSFIKSFIYELSSQGFRFAWYKQPASMKASSIVMFLRHGHMKATGQHCGPRLAWCDVASDEVYGIGLFEIGSLEKATAQHLRDYPFVIPARSIFVQLSRNRDFVFEARTEEDAHTFVHGLRWVIARLTFNLVIGNLGVSCELLDVVLGDEGEPDIDDASPSRRRLPETPLEEAKWSKAMDDVTNEWIDKSVLRRAPTIPKLQR